MNKSRKGMSVEELSYRIDGMGTLMPYVNESHPDRLLEAIFPDGISPEFKDVLWPYPGESAILDCERNRLLIRLWLVHEPGIQVPNTHSSVEYVIPDSSKADPELTFFGFGAKDGKVVEISVPDIGFDSCLWPKLRPMAEAFDLGENRSNVSSICEYNPTVPEGILLAILIEMRGGEEAREGLYFNPESVVKRVAKALAL